MIEVQDYLIDFLSLIMIHHIKGMAYFVMTTLGAFLRVLRDHLPKKIARSF